MKYVSILEYFWTSGLSLTHLVIYLKRGQIILSSAHIDILVNGLVNSIMTYPRVWELTQNCNFMSSACLRCADRIEIKGYYYDQIKWPMTIVCRTIHVDGVLMCCIYITNVTLWLPKILIWTECNRTVTDSRKMIFKKSHTITVI